MSDPNNVEIPLARIEESLLACAVPRFYGEVRIHISLLPTAALEINMIAETKTVTAQDVTRVEGSILPSDERVNKIRARLTDLSEKLRLILPVTDIRAVFKDGFLLTLETIETEKLEIPTVPRKTVAAH